MNKVSIKSPQISNSFRMFRVQAQQHNVNEVKDYIMDKMNNYLEKNDG